MGAQFEPQREVVEPAPPDLSMLAQGIAAWVEMGAELIEPLGNVKVVKAFERLQVELLRAMGVS